MGATSSMSNVNNPDPAKTQVNDIDAKEAIDIKVQEINRILNDNPKKIDELMNYIMEKLEKKPDSKASEDESSEKPSVNGGSKKKIRNTRNRRNRRNRRNTKKR